MKRNWILIILLLITILGCEQAENAPDPVVIPDPVHPKLQVTLSASADFGVDLTPAGTITVFEGDTVSFAFSPKSGRSIKAVKINGNPINSYPNKIYKKMGDNMVVIFPQYKTDLSVSSILNDSLYLASYKWYRHTAMFGHIQENQDTIWTFGVSSDPSHTYTSYMVFELDGACFKKDKNNVIFGGPYPWCVENGYITIAGKRDYQIVTLNRDILIEQSTAGNVIFRCMYKHYPLDPKFWILK
jgi:hypothetical protein